jgi:hypothetical protein
MTASALNIASIAPPAQAGVGAAAKAAGAGPLAGFEALLAALFPQGDPSAATPAGGQAAPVTTDLPATADTLVDGGAKDDAAASETPVDAVAVDTPSPGDAAAALAASLMAIQPATAETPITAPKGAGADATTAFGRDKAKGVPAEPALLHANPNARLAEEAGLAPEAADEATPPVGTKGPDAPTGPQAPQTPPQARNAAAPPAAAAPATPPPTAAPARDVQPDLALADAAAEAPVEAPPAETTAAAASLAPRPDAAPAPAPNSRAAKSERAKATMEAKAAASDDLEPLEAVEKPVHAKAAQAAQAAGKDASTTIEAAEARPEDTKAASESPDAPMQGETRAASQAASPAAATTHLARGGPETVANLAAQIVKKLEGKSTRFDVQLDPHGLGKVDVRIEIGAQGRITAGMTFDNPQAAADVKARAAELQRALEQAGFDISGGLSFDVAQDRGQQQQQNQAWQDQGDTGRAFQGRAFRAALETAGDAADAANQGALRLRRGVNSGLDLRI